MTKAHYHKQLIPEFENNPLIEALPPIIIDKAKRVKVFRAKNKITDEERQLNPQLRQMKLLNISKIFVPMNWAIHLSKNIDMMIREGYRRRNPLTGNRLEQAYNIDATDVNNLPDLNDPVGNAFLIGCSGSGKTTTTSKYMTKNYDQVIIHDNYAGVDMDIVQIVYLYVNIPDDASIKGFCFSILSEIDRLVGTDYTSHYNNCSIAILSDLIAKLCSLYCVGMIFLDESQNLIYSNKRSGRLDEFLNVLSNKIGTPLYFIGTPKALDLMNGSFHLCRRLESRGSIRLNPYNINSQDWKNFVDTLWNEAIYLNGNNELTPELFECFHRVSGGIPAILKNILYEVQFVILENEGEELLTVERVEEIVEERFNGTERDLQEIRNNNISRIISMGDIFCNQLETIREQESRQKPKEPSKDNKKIEQEDELYNILVSIGYSQYLSESQLKEQVQSFLLETEPGTSLVKCMPSILDRLDTLINLQKESSEESNREEIELEIADESTLC